MDRYDAIALRHSVRSYDNRQLTPGIIADIKRAALEADTLGFSGRFELNLIDNSDGAAQKYLFKGLTGQYGSVAAPCYLHCRTAQGADREIHAGIALENAVLECTRRGIGTCWIGVPLNDSHIDTVLGESYGMENCIMLAMGFPSGKASDVPPTKRKSIDKIVSGVLFPEAQTLIEAARIAPSSMNSQPWSFVLDGRRITLMLPRRPATRLSQTLARLNRIDAGIALCHMSLAAKHFGIDASFSPLTDENEAIATIDIM